VPARDPLLLRFGRRIRKLRSAAGFSQEAFASKCGLDRTYIGGIERGERNVSLRNLKLLARALKIQLSELVRDI
jgi:transcriptional regulator with XRE-family HTH domain